MPWRDSKAWKMGLSGALGGGLGSLITEVLPFIQGPPRTILGIIIRVGVWFGVIGAAISVAILLVQSRYLRQQWQGGRAAKQGIPAGLVAGAVAGGLAQFLYSFIGPTEVLRVICWGIAGGLLGGGLSLRIPNLGWQRGMAGGALGGFLGGIIFILLAMNYGNVAGRFLGIAVIGFFIGLMLVFVEALSRKIWLDVVYGPREVVSVTLGAEPVRIGSSSEVATVFVAGAAPVAMEFSMTGDQVMVKHVMTGEAAPVRPGERLKLAEVEIVVRSAGEGPQAPAPPPPEAPPSKWWLDHQDKP